MASPRKVLSFSRRRLLQAVATGVLAPGVAALGVGAPNSAAHAARGVAPWNLPSFATARQRENVLQVGRLSEVAPVWSPLKASTGVHAQVFDLVFNRLVRFDEKFNLIPDLAERFEISPDATTFTFYLRRDVKWHDGQPFSARDVVFTYKLALNKGAAARQKGKIGMVKGGEDYFQGAANDVAGITQLDDYTVRFTLDKPNVAWLIGPAHSNTLVWILPEHILKDMDPAQIDRHPFTLNPTVGTGPFKWVQHVPDQFVEFAANPDYFAGAPRIGRVFVRLAEPATALAQLERGELDLMPKVSPKDVDRLKAQSQLAIISAPGVGVFQTAFNCERFTDRRVRQAFMYSVDREALIRVVLRGEGRLVHSTVIGPDWANYNDLNPYQRDVGRARQLLQDAGWDFSRKVELTWPKGFQDIELAAPVFQQQLKDAGVDIALQPLETAAFVKKYVNDSDFDMAWFSGGVYAMDPDVSSLYYECNNFTPRGANGTHYCNAELDALFDQGRGTPDISRRQETYAKVARTLNEDVPTFFWWSENIIWGMSTRLQGPRPGPNVDIFWNAHEWSLT